ncbi:hypothetical protein BDZ97DRAFT_524061 [Flammula alnicola]|nr:hypothetical protein BDZ97DRAFT_524061 [Flammula alnicola]
MANSMDPQVLKITVIGASHLPLTLSKREPKAFIELRARNISRRTFPIDTASTEPRWARDREFTLGSLSRDTTITFLAFHKGFAFNELLGRAEKTVGELLDLGDDIDVNLPLTDKKGRATSAEIIVRAAVTSLPKGASLILEQTQKRRNLVAQSTNMEIISAKTVVDAVIDDEDLQTALESVLSKVSILLKLGDEIAKVHPFVNLAWQVVAVGLKASPFNRCLIFFSDIDIVLQKIVQKQRMQNLKLLGLTRTMRDLYSVVTSDEGLQKISSVEDVIEKILFQTIECGYFIQHVLRQDFRDGVVGFLTLTTEMKIERFSQAFKDLRDKFDRGLAVGTAIVSAHTFDVVQSFDRKLNLESLRWVPMETHKRPICLPGTRLEILKSVEEWLANTAIEQRAFWVSGLAGTGKSTLSTTIANMLRSVNRLGAFVFFDRDAQDRSDPGMLIRTVASQLAKFDDRIGIAISSIIEELKTISETSLQYQFENLLVRALSSVTWPYGPIAVVIDALDECGNEKDRQTLLNVLSDGLKGLPPFIRIILTSRPEPDITRTFEQHYLVESKPLDIGAAENMTDIAAFIRYRTAEIQKKHQSFEPDWPGDDIIQDLTERSFGLFVWAATACRYMDSYDPRVTLQNVLGKSVVTSGSSTAFTALHSLYETTIRAAGNWDDAEFARSCNEILGIILVAKNPISCSAIDVILSRSESSTDTVNLLLCFLRRSKNGTVHSLHPSFLDYLANDGSDGCKDKPWFIDRKAVTLQVALRCVELLDKELKENICGLTLPHWDSAKTLPDGISYACRFWVEHVSEVSDMAYTASVAEKIHLFLNRHLLHWIEAMVILNYHGEIIHLLRVLFLWTKKFSPELRDLRQLLYDGWRFTRYFSNTIQQHPLLVYSSALPFTPARTSIFGNFHHERLPRLQNPQQFWPPELQQLRGHKLPVRAVAFSPDGSKIASGSDDATIRVWDSYTGNEIIPPLGGHSGGILSVALSDTRVVSAATDGTIRVWDIITGKEILGLLPIGGRRSYAVISVALSPDGSKIVSGLVDGTVRVWDINSGQEILRASKGHAHAVTYASFSPDGSTIMSSSHVPMDICVWDAATGQSIPRKPQESIFQIGSNISFEKKFVWDEFTASHPDMAVYHFPSMAFSPDASQIVAISKDGKTIQVWNANTGVETFPPFSGHSDWVTSVAYSRDGSKILSGSVDKTVRVWDANPSISRGKVPGLLSNLEARVVLSIAFSQDGTKIVSSSRDGAIVVWDIKGGTTVANLSPPRGIRTANSDGVTSVAFLPQDGKKIVSAACNDTTIRVWKAKTGKDIFPPITAHSRGVMSIACSPDGSKFVSGSLDKTVRLWDALTGKQIFQLLQGQEAHVLSVSFSPDGSRIISGSRDNSICIWDAKTGEMIHNHGPIMRLEQDTYNPRAVCAAFSPNTAIFLSSCERNAYILDANTGEEIAQPLTSHGNGWVKNDWFKFIAFSPDGSKVALGCGNPLLCIWDLANRGVPPKMIAHPFDVHSAGFSPNGTKIASASGGKIYIMDTDTGKLDTTLITSSSDNQDGLSGLLPMPFNPASQRITLDRDGWLIDTLTNVFLTKIYAELPKLDYWLSHGSTFVGWISGDKPPFEIHFPGLPEPESPNVQAHDSG